MQDKHERTKKYTNYQPNLFKEQEYDYLFKIGVFGSPGTGKSSLIRRASENAFSGDHLITKPLHFVNIMTKSKDAIAKLQVWELPSNKKWDS